MQTNQVNLVLDVRQNLGQMNGDQLENELAGVQGVSRVQVSARARRLVLVDYDPQTVSAHDILGRVTRRGFDARLVGM
jgi:copper chaperone CopZ